MSDSNIIIDKEFDLKIINFIENFKINIQYFVNFKFKIFNVNFN